MTGPDVWSQRYLHKCPAVHASLLADECCRVYASTLPAFSMVSLEDNNVGPSLWGIGLSCTILYDSGLSTNMCWTTSLRLSPLSRPVL